MAEKTKKTNKKEKEQTQSSEAKVAARLFEKYKSEIAPALMKQFSYKSVMQVPKLEKIVVNMGVGAAVQDSKALDEAVKDLETITGQKASLRTAKKAISNFKLREGMKIGAKVTLRRDRMYEFLDRIISIAMPRIRDFRGVSDKSFDGRGNYTLGLKEQIIFPEINIDRINRVVGMDITFVTNSKSDQEAFELLKLFGFPFKKKEINNG
ncbi:MAG: 50S ribosomal protein L5 [Ignavibacteriae bacterium]|nr:50S ribosomal protein L5 [Ignavibacteriota bacterium]MCB0750314.1 50S ribosomal protein L5 [Ignavibacteriota bacterium]